jgi:peroxin-6
MSGTFETQLRVLVVSALRGMAHSLYLDDPVLLKGASGAGIFTSVTKVAESVGMHIQEVDWSSLSIVSCTDFNYEINIYEMVGESIIHTVAAVTARAEAAVAYGPCLVVLRHLEGLSNASQGGNTDEEGE